MRDNSRRDFLCPNTTKNVTTSRPIPQEEPAVHSFRRSPGRRSGSCLYSGAPRRFLLPGRHFLFEAPSCNNQKSLAWTSRVPRRPPSPEVMISAREGEVGRARIVRLFRCVYHWVDAAAPRAG